MKLIAALMIAAGVWLVVAAWRRHRERVAEQEAFDREYRESILRRARIKPRNEEEEDYLLKLRAGRKPNANPATQPPTRSAGSPNKFLD